MKKGDVFKDIKNGIDSIVQEPLAQAFVSYKLRFSDMPKGEYFGNALSPVKVDIGKHVIYKDIKYKVTTVQYGDSLGNNVLTVKAAA